MTYQISIPEEFDTIFDVTHALEEIKSQIEQGYTSGTGFLTWNLSQESEKE